MDPKCWPITTTNVLANHTDTKIVRHVMVKPESLIKLDKAKKSKGYGNISPSKVKLLNWQNDQCRFCGSQF